MYVGQLLSVDKHFDSGYSDTQGAFGGRDNPWIYSDFRLKK